MKQREGVNKMKRIKLVITLVALIMLSWTGTIYPATCADWTCVANVNIPVNAQVPDGTPVLTIQLKKLTSACQEPSLGSDATSMDFGQLTHVLDTGEDAGLWFSASYYCVLIYTTSFGHRYEIKSTCAGLTSGANSLPAGSFGVTPQYRPEDMWVWPGGSAAQGSQPALSLLGTAGSAVATDKLIYRSEPGASNRIIRAFYSLPNAKISPCGGGSPVDPFPGYASIPLSQAAGTYSGTVTISIVAI